MITKKEINDRINEINNSLFTDEYNVGKYLFSFNNKVKPLLVCFSEEIRKDILLDIVKIKDKTTKIVTEKLKERVIFSKSQCGLISGIPNKPSDQDSYEELMRMEDKEIKFWDSVNKVPNNMEETEWNEIRVDYHDRVKRMREEVILLEQNRFDKIFKQIELDELIDLKLNNIVPIDIFKLASVDLDDTGVYFKSRDKNERIFSFQDIFRYENEAIIRNEFYKTNNIENDENRYQLWLDKLAVDSVMMNDIEIKNNDALTLATINEEKMRLHLEEQSSKIVEEIIEENKVKKVYSEDDDYDDDDEIQEDEITGEIKRKSEIIILDDEVDDTYGEKPDDYTPIISIEKEDDGWLF